MAWQAKKALLTLYMTQEDFNKALFSAIDILTKGDLPKNEAGFTSIDLLCEKIRGIHPSLSYLNRNHIVELYFKDRDRKIFISGLDEIKYKEVRYVQPPAVLYFGTLNKLSAKMQAYGIKSSTKGYLKLYDSVNAATDFARKFIRSPEDHVEVLEIRAMAAFTDGLKFSTFKSNEYIVVRIDKKYIVGPVQ
jgi:hypothetical protein